MFYFFFAALYLLIAADWELKLGEQVNGLGKNKYLDELKYTVKPVLPISLYAMGFISAKLSYLEKATHTIQFNK